MIYDMNLNNRAGWQCPICKKVYAPTVLSCTCQQKTVTDSSSFITHSLTSGLSIEAKKEILREYGYNIDVVEDVWYIHAEVITPDGWTKETDDYHLDDATPDQVIAEATGLAWEHYLRYVVGLVSLGSDDDAFMRAKGALKWQDGDEPAEDTIRRIRDDNDE